QHHRRVVEGRQGRAARLRELPDPSPEFAERAQSQDRVERRRAPEAGAVLQGRKATARARQRLRLLQAGSIPPARLGPSPTSPPPRPRADACSVKPSPARTIARAFFSPPAPTRS